ncbi:hypothetical protein, partial [Escherichia coli]|uniref:hypothetical protein n=1 Tax=Escherichia coli TaxID=562 RepID=UPI0019603D29
FTVLNSDPYIRTPTPTELNINEIEKVKILPRISAIKHNGKLLTPFFGLNNNEKEEIGREIRKEILRDEIYIDKIYIFLSAFVYALPVFIISYLQ